MRAIKISTLVGLLGLLSACATTREYIPPEIDKSTRYSQNLMVAQTGDVADISWWDLFKDKQLVALIEEGLDNNYTLQNTLSAIKQAQLQLDIVDAGTKPSITYGLNDKITDSSVTAKQENLNAFAHINYTLDFWGKLRNQNEAAYQLYMATTMAHHQVKSTLVAQIANSYFALKDLDNKTYYAQRIVNSLTKFRNIIRAKYKTGLISKVDLNQVEIQLRNTKLQLLQLKSARKQLENALNVLVGSAPKKRTPQLSLKKQLHVVKLPASVPADLLVRRPSLLIAERKLRAQLATIGATEALQYPDFTFSLTLGKRLNTPENSFGEFVGGLVGPLFDAGRIDNRIAFEKEQYKTLVNNYKQSYLQAFAEVENALVKMDTHQRELKINKESVVLAKEAYNLAWTRYTEGATSLLDFLNLQTSLLTAQLQMSDNQKSYLQSVVELYLALGGGWTETSPATKKEKTDKTEE